MTDAARLRSFVERVEFFKQEIREINADIADIYKEARAADFDPQGIKDLVAHRRDPDKAEKRGATFDEYLALLHSPPHKNAPAANSGRLRGHPEKVSPTRAHVHVHEANKSELAVSPSSLASPTDGATRVRGNSTRFSSSSADDVGLGRGPVGASGCDAAPSAGSQIEAAPPGGVGGVIGDAAMTTDTRGHPDNLEIPKVLLRDANNRAPWMESVSE